jgi:hypothetical protein
MNNPAYRGLPRYRNDVMKKGVYNPPSTKKPSELNPKASLILLRIF